MDGCQHFIFIWSAPSHLHAANMSLPSGPHPDPIQPTSHIRPKTPLHYRGVRLNFTQLATQHLRKADSVSHYPAFLRFDELLHDPIHDWIMRLPTLIMISDSIIVYHTIKPPPKCIIGNLRDYDTNYALLIRYLIESKLT